MYHKKLIQRFPNLMNYLYYFESGQVIDQTLKAYLIDAEKIKKLFDVLSGEIKHEVKEYFENYLREEKSSCTNLHLKNEFFNQIYMAIFSAKNNSNDGINKTKNHNANDKINIVCFFK